MLSKKIQLLQALAAARKRIRASSLPVTLKSEIARSATLLLLRPAHRFPNPVPVVGAWMSYSDPTQLRYLFQEIFVDACYCFRTESRMPVIVDCGSNIGMSVLFFKKLYPTARIVAFEPDPSTFAILSKNVSQNGLADIELHQVALGDTDGMAEFYRGTGAGGLIMSLMKERLADGKINVPVRRLSQFINEDVDLLKLDIEGAEDQVMSDLASNGKLNLIGQIHLEYHHHIRGDVDHLSAILWLLEENGFGYQLAARPERWPSRNLSQDILIYAYRKGSS